MAGDLFTGTLELLILRTLANDLVHGYGIARSIREKTDGVLDVEQGALYPALHRLNRRGFLKGEWGETETGRRARFYSLTKKGQAALAQETTRWDEHAKAVYAVLKQVEG
ncbi:MAG: PadR family transcriptional regulator [Gemmatimonadetes bacterium]|nr:PadR family transcriptional regulator [Gemmatimonadota bacterium]